MWSLPHNRPRNGHAKVVHFIAFDWNLIEIYSNNNWKILPHGVAGTVRDDVYQSPTMTSSYQNKTKNTQSVICQVLSANTPDFRGRIRTPKTKVNMVAPRRKPKTITQDEPCLRMLPYWSVSIPSCCKWHHLTALKLSSLRMPFVTRLSSVLLG